MRDTENTAMASTATVYRPSLASTALGNQDETWSLVDTLSCDIWPIARFSREKHGETQEISTGEYYISFPYNADIRITDVVDIDGITYEVTFVPKTMSWLTNLRVEAKSYNLVLKVKT